MKWATYVGCLAGVAILLVLAVHANLPGLIETVKSGGPNLGWLIPYRALFFLLYAIGWWVLLRPSDAAHRAGLGYVFWATAVRDSVDRLLPVASVGGSLVGVRVLTWRGLPAAPVAASVIMEILLTLVAVYLFTALGLVLLTAHGDGGHEFRRLLIVFALSLPVPAVLLALLRSGAVLERLHAFMHLLVGAGVATRGAASLDQEVRAALGRPGGLVTAGVLQVLALLSGAFEIWFALRLFDHPVSVDAAVALESMTQAVRHLAFVVPGGLGVQEAGLVLFGHVFGLDGDSALAVAMVKRMRELAWGIPFLLSWQWLEGRRLRRAR